MKYSVMVEVDIGEWMYASADNPWPAGLMKW
jgi:hypothetical protein